MLRTAISGYFTYYFTSLEGYELPSEVLALLDGVPSENECSIHYNMAVVERLVINVVYSLLLRSERCLGRHPAEECEQNAAYLSMVQVRHGQ